MSTNHEPYPVEIKVNVDGAVDAALTLLGDPGGATDRQIWFAEQRSGLARGELGLNSAGIIVRVRSGDGRDDTTVKLRPCVESRLRGRWTEPFEKKRQAFEYRIEGDWSGLHRVLSASAVNTFGSGTQAQVGGAGLGERVMGERQRDFLRRCATIPVSVDELVALGPIASTKWSDLAISDLSVDAERWTIADLDFLELSIKVEPGHDETAEDFEARALEHQTRLQDAVDRLGIRRAVNTDNKTLRVLTTLAALVHH